MLGINDQIASSSGDNAGVGFAIPIDIANDVAQRIINGQSLDVGYLGVSTGENPSSNEPGALITQVVAGSPAEKAGLKDGDVVYQVGDQAIRSYIELQAQIRQHRPGDKVELEGAPRRRRHHHHRHARHPGPVTAGRHRHTSYPAAAADGAAVPRGSGAVARPAHGSAMPGPLPPVRGWRGARP